MKEWGSRIANTDDARLTFGLLQFLIECDEQGHAVASPGIGRLWATEEGERLGGEGPLYRIALSLDFDFDL